MALNPSGGMGGIVTTGIGKTVGIGGRKKAKQGTLKAGLFNKCIPCFRHRKSIQQLISSGIMRFRTKFASGSQLFSRVGPPMQATATSGELRISSRTLQGHAGISSISDRTQSMRICIALSRRAEAPPTHRRNSQVVVREIAEFQASFVAVNTLTF